MMIVINGFGGMVDHQKCLAIFPARAIVRDPQNCKSLIWCGLTWEDGYHNIQNSVAQYKKVFENYQKSPQTSFLIIFISKCFPHFAWLGWFLVSLPSISVFDNDSY